MTKEQASKLFVESHYEDNRNLRAALKADRLAVQFEWSCYIDSLCRDGEITMKQYESWTFPWPNRREN